MTDLNFSKAQ